MSQHKFKNGKVPQQMEFHIATTDENYLKLTDPQSPVGKAMKELNNLAEEITQKKNGITIKVVLRAITEEAQ
jgi:hypothetical protein